MENSKKLIIIFLCLIILSCANRIRMAYQTNEGKNKLKYYNSVYDGNKKGIKKYGKRLNKQK